MKTKLITSASWAFIALSALSVLYVSFLAMFDPQQVMWLVHVDLNNNDALSSIRGVFGGVGITLAATLGVLSVRDRRYGLQLLALFWGMYAVSRLITIIADGPLGSFGKQWLMIESSFSCIALLLLYFNHRSASAQ